MGSGLYSCGESPFRGHVGELVNLLAREENSPIERRNLERRNLGQRPFILVSSACP